MAASVLVLFAGCKKAPEKTGEGKVIKLGEYASISGATASFGRASHNGTAMAIEELNAKGGVLGKPIELVTEDDQSKPGEAAMVVRKLISRDRVVAILGEVASSRSLEGAPICQENKVPMLTPASTNPKVTMVGDYIFRICFLDPFQGTVMAKFCMENLGKKRVAILMDVKQDYSVGLTKYFKEYLTANGGTVVSEQSFSSQDKDFNAQLTAIKGANPDAVFVPGYYAEVALIALQAKQLGLNVPLLGGDGWDSETLVKVAGDAMEGNYFSNHFSTQDADPKIKAFVSAYQKKYNALPDAMSALGYDSAMILVDAIQRAGSVDRAKIREALAQTKNYSGITGKITIDKERNATKSAVVLQIKGGKFEYVATVNP